MGVFCYTKVTESVRTSGAGRCDNYQETEISCGTNVLRTTNSYTIMLTLASAYYTRLCKF